MEEHRIAADLNDPSTYEIYRPAEGPDIPILYEDNHLLIAVKPAGVLSQADGSYAPDMLTLLKEYIKIKGNKPGDAFLGLVHRLDRPVSGVMVFAKTSKAASRISQQIREKTVVKKYCAVVRGVPVKKEGTLRTRLVKEAGNKVRIGDDGEDGEGKEAVLRYRLAETDPGSGASLLEIVLETGRSHQIRVQLANAGHAILGDKKYGDPLETYKGDIALFSCSLTFKHPTRDVVLRVFAAPFSRHAWKPFAESLLRIGDSGGDTDIEKQERI